MKKGDFMTNRQYQPLYAVSIGFLFLLGVAHTILSFLLFTWMSFEQFWFLGTGLALFYTAAINYIHLKIQVELIRRVCMGINIMTGIFAGALALIFQHIPGTLVAFTSLILMYFCLNKNNKV